MFTIGVDIRCYKLKMVVQEQSNCRSLTVGSRFKKLLLLLFIVTFLVTFFYVQQPLHYKLSFIRRMLYGETQTDHSRPLVHIQNHGDVVIRKENFMFIKTHKCGTSSLVNVFYLLGVRRRLNFVIQRGQHQLYLGSDQR